MAEEANESDRSFQTIKGEDGEWWQIRVARHAHASTFDFDIRWPGASSIQNMTRADLEEHVARCQAALDES